MKSALFLLLLSFSVMAEEQVVCGKIKTLEVNSWTVKATIEDREFFNSSKNEIIAQAMLAAKTSKSKICATYYDPTGSSDGKFSINSITF